MPFDNPVCPVPQAVPALVFVEFTYYLFAMCTVVISRTPGAPWPLILAANRDEMAGRPWRPPARHWDEHPHVVAGIDEEAGGTWMGLNDDGLVACILNRPGSLGPQAGKRSRGELPLEALSHAEAREAAEALSHLDARAYRSFNLVIADALDAYWVRSDGEARVEAHPIAEGVSMVTAHDLNDLTAARIAAHLPGFRAAPTPDPDTGDWHTWKTLLSARSDEKIGGERVGMTVGDGTGFGTVCSSLVALPGPARFGETPIWLFAAGAPDRVPFEPVDLM